MLEDVNPSKLTIFSDCEPSERLEKLKSQAHRICFHGYNREMTEKEYNQLVSEHTTVAMELDEANEDKKIIADKVKSLQSQYDALVQKLRFRQTEDNSKCYEFMDKYEGLVYIYDENGVLRKTRKMTTDDKNLTASIEFNAENNEAQRK